MTVSICLNYPEKNANRTQWDYALLNFKPDNIYIIGADGREALGGKVMSSAIYIQDVSELPPEVELVVLAPRTGVNIQGTEELSTFIHPTNCVYYFGSNEGTLQISDFTGRKPDSLVYIDTDSTDDMWSWVTWAVVSYDRRTKLG